MPTGSKTPPAVQKLQEMMQEMMRRNQTSAPTLVVPNFGVPARFTQKRPAVLDFARMIHREEQLEAKKANGPYAVGRKRRIMRQLGRLTRGKSVKSD